MTMLEGLGFPEALRWRDGALWFSDMFRSRVMRWVPGAQAETVLDLSDDGPTVPGGLGWLPDGSLLVVDCEQRRVLRVHDGAVTVHADLADLMTHSANDMHVDPDGTAWVGGYGFDPEHDEPVPSPLVRVGADGEASATASAFVFPNGCERDARGALLVAETFADRVSSMSPDNAVTQRARFEPGSGPDGLSIAPDGAVYVALAFAAALARLAPLEAGPDAPAEFVYRAEPIASGPGAGPLGVYDCAVHPDGRRIAVAMASLDEALAERVDTGRIVVLEL
ncbi:SMP-30/gluconolactonase/LRE family protein [Microcella sp.]|uniref:SMP-30/gluconolactonase/LRE family protein n=1 Tax=Microcella sp. TaxID=1913979 RepID=UPI00256454A7|nr:SMP-30/gluconolactonase/LRE family protein [Microcella sp.]MBX9472038.1 SMP-30/gluconolactonase/LRE family protein [Microcella sp.]